MSTPAKDIKTLTAPEKPALLPLSVRETIVARWEAATTDEAREALMTDAGKNLAVAPNNTQALFTAAYGHELIDDHDNAGKGYLRLARVLAAAENWEDARDISLRALPHISDHRLVRYLLQADSKLELDEEQKQADIAVARRYCPDAPDLLWLDSQAADAAGNEREAARLAGAALMRYVSYKDAARAEEPLLRVLESGVKDYLADLISLIPKMIAHGLEGLVKTTLEFGLPEIRKYTLLPQLADAFENVLLYGKPPDWLRATFVDVLADSLGGKEPLRDIIDESKIADDNAPFEKALGKFRELCVFRPGAYVEHNTWGIGAIKGNDGSTLIVDFAEKPNHRMNLEIAHRALRPLDADLLRVIAFRDPDILAREAADDPVALVIRAIKECDEDATAKEIKPRLIGTAILEAQWTNWWKGARTKAATDPRIDHSKVHQGVYEMAKEGQSLEPEKVDLPPLEPKKGLKGAVLAIGRMLKQNPHIEDQVKAQYSATLEKWVKDAHEADDRLRGTLYLSRWQPERHDHWVSIAADAILSRRSGILSISTPNEQMQLLELGLAGAHWKEAALSGLASRFNAVRQHAIEALQGKLGDGLRAALEEALTDAARHPLEALAIADLDLQGVLPLPDGGHLDPWDILHATLIVLIVADHKTVFNEALEVLDPQEELARRIKDSEPSQEALARFAAASERYELPGAAAEAAIRLLTDTGFKKRIGEILGERYVDKGEDLIGLHFSPRITLMTRATFIRSTADVESMRHELATTIPREIAAARALGDLRENAEYHAARERQGIMTAMEKTLNGELQQARIIDDLKMPDGIVGVGTEVVIHDLDTDEKQTLWLLGHRDNEMYDAINYRAPLGQALCGKKIGEIVEVDQDGKLTMLEIVSVRHRSPIGEPRKMEVIFPEATSE